MLALVSLLAGCSAPPVTFDRSHPANPQASEASTPPARPRLVEDERTRETERRFASVNEVQTNEPPPIQQAGLQKHQPLSAVKEGAEKMHATEAYVCPMHPEVRSDNPGNCPKCGMKLVKAKEARGGGHEQ
jgi:hypothetical protein